MARNAKFAATELINNILKLLFHLLTIRGPPRSPRSRPRDRRQAFIASDRIKLVDGVPLLDPTAYAAGGKKIRFLALLDEIGEMSCVHMIRANHCGEALESPSPPALKGNGIKIRFKHAPARFYHLDDSLLDRHR